MNIIEHKTREWIIMGLGTVFVVGSVVKLAIACGVGIGASSMLKFFHDYELKFNGKKGERNEKSSNHSESLRERTRGL